MQEKFNTGHYKKVLNFGALFIFHFAAFPCVFVIVASLTDTWLNDWVTKKHFYISPPVFEQ